MVYFNVNKEAVQGTTTTVKITHEKLKQKHGKAISTLNQLDTLIDGVKTTSITVPNALRKETKNELLAEKEFSIQDEKEKLLYIYSAANVIKIQFNEKINKKFFKRLVTWLFGKKISTVNSTADKVIEKCEKALLELEDQRTKKTQTPPQTPNVETQTPPTPPEQPKEPLTLDQRMAAMGARPLVGLVNNNVTSQATVQGPLTEVETFVNAENAKIISDAIAKVAAAAARPAQAKAKLEEEGFNIDDVLNTPDPLQAAYVQKAIDLAKQKRDAKEAQNNKIANEAQHLPNVSEMSREQAKVGLPTDQVKNAKAQVAEKRNAQHEAAKAFGLGVVSTPVVHTAPTTLDLNSIPAFAPPPPAPNTFALANEGNQKTSDAPKSQMMEHDDKPATSAPSKPSDDETILAVLAKQKTDLANNLQKNKTNVEKK